MGVEKKSKARHSTKLPCSPPPAQPGPKPLLCNGILHLHGGPTVPDPVRRSEDTERVRFAPTLEEFSSPHGPSPELSTVNLNSKSSHAVPALCGHMLCAFLAHPLTSSQ